jgi:hypothetical protein
VERRENSWTNTWILCAGFSTLTGLEYGTLYGLGFPGSSAQLSWASIGSALALLAMVLFARALFTKQWKAAIGAIALFLLSEGVVGIAAVSMG